MTVPSATSRTNEPRAWRGHFPFRGVGKSLHCDCGWHAENANVLAWWDHVEVEAAQGAAPRTVPRCCTEPQDHHNHVSDLAAPRAEGLDPLTNRYESALNRIANLGMDAAAFGPDPADFYRDQLMTAIGTAARSLSRPSDERDPESEEPR